MLELSCLKQGVHVDVRTPLGDDPWDCNGSPDCSGHWQEAPVRARSS